MPIDQAEAHRLIETHQQRLVRWFYARIRDRDTAADLAQRTWVEVLPRIHTFDSTLGSFFTFTKVWALFALKRHWAETARQRYRAEEDAPAGGGVDEGDDLPEGGRIDQGAAGEAHPNRIAELVEASEMHIELLRRALTCKRLPHEIIAFGIVKLLDWTPRRVVADLSDTSLDNAAAFLESEYFRNVPLPEVREAFQPLRAGLAHIIASYDIDARISRPYTHLAERVAATTVLRDYYPAEDDPEVLVTRWWAAVNRAVRNDLLRLSAGRLAEWLHERGLAQERTNPK